jgi:hypothetical protein
MHEGTSPDVLSWEIIRRNIAVASSDGAAVAQQVDSVFPVGACEALRTRDTRGGQPDGIEQVT